jgi:hypothetical protein
MMMRKNHQIKKKELSVEEADKIIQLREELQNMFKQTRIDDVTDKENREKQYEPITQRLDKVEKAVPQTDEDLSKKLELLPKFKPKQLTYKPLSEDEGMEEKSIKTIMDKGTGVIYKGFGALPRKYLPFPDDKFGIWYDEDNVYIGDKSNEILVDGNNLIVSGEKYKGTHGLWRLLTNPNKKNLDQETYDTWWTNKDNFTEKDLYSYKEILKKTYSIHQNNDPSSKIPKSSMGKKWQELVSQIWKEIKPPKPGSGLVKYHDDLIEYKYIYHLNQLLQRLYFIYAEEKAGNNNYHNEKIGIINFFAEQLEQNIDKPKGTEYIIRFINSLPKGLFKTGSGVFNTVLNKLKKVIPELRLPGYNYCGPFTKLDKRLARGDEPINKLDAGCKDHDIFYRDHKDTKERHIADKELENIAAERMHASDASIRERIDVALVRTAMKSKGFLGMGLKY